MKKQKKKALKNIAFLSFLFAFFLFTRLVIQPVIVVGQSMEPTFKEGNMLLVNRTVDSYERFDIIVVWESNMYIVKRVVGLPGETIQIKDSNIYINGEIIDDVYDGSMDPGYLSEPVTLGSNEYIVLGDNRDNSSDSRVFGPVLVDDIMGKALTNK